MANVYCYPSGSKVSNGAWTDSGSFPGCIQSDDGDTTYEYCEYGYAGYYFHCPFDDLPAAAALVNQVDFYDVTRRDGTNTVQLRRYQYANSTQYWVCGNWYYPGGSYAAHGDTNVSYGPGGGWTPSNFNATQWGIQEIGDDTWGSFMRVTQLYAYVDYTPAGECIIVVWSKLLPLIGIIRDLVDVARIARVAEPRVRYTREELEWAWQSLRNVRRGYSWPSVLRSRQRRDRMPFSRWSWNTRTPSGLIVAKPRIQTSTPLHATC